MKRQSVKSIVVWGDSLARGVVYDEARKRYAISSHSALRIVSEETGIAVENRSRMGMTTDVGLLRMREDIERGIKGDIAFLEFGGNDSDFDWRAISEAPDEEHLPKTTLQQYEKNMTEMVKLAERHCMTPVMTTLPPLISERYFDFFSRDGLNRGNILRWLGDVNKIYRFHERYSLKAAEIAKRCNCHLVDLRAAFLEKWDPRPLFCADGIHPNDTGQELIGRTLLRDITGEI